MLFFNEELLPRVSGFENIERMRADPELKLIT